MLSKEEIKLQQEGKELVAREVLCCASHLVQEISELANGESDFAIECWGVYCEEEDEYFEVLEHWIVSDWLARQLERRDEKVLDFGNLKFWCRTCSGQAIYLDGVIEDIVREFWGLNSFKL